MSAPIGSTQYDHVSKLSVTGWRQFESVQMAFHPQLTIVTGANGAGKSTLLNLLSPMFGWKVPFASVPAPFRQLVVFATNVWRTLAKTPMPFGRAEPDAFETIGEIEFNAGEKIAVRVPLQAGGHTYSVTFDREVNLAGLFIPSHRPVFSPITLGTLRSVYSIVEAHERYVEAVRAAWHADKKSERTPLQVLKEALVSWVELGDKVHQQYFVDFSAILGQVLPNSTGFRELAVVEHEVVLQTDTGDFTLDAVSGGIAAVIDLAWQIFSFRSSHSGGFVVVIDEPENHLHPEMQRNVLPNLIAAFADVQFIVASHAPLVITSVRDSEIYALMYRERPLDGWPFPTSDSGPSAAGAAAPLDICVDAEVLGSDTVAPCAPQAQSEALFSVTRRRAIKEAGRLSDYVKRQMNADLTNVRATVVARQLTVESRSGTANDILRGVLGLDYTMPVWASDVLDAAVDDVAKANYSPAAIHELDRRLSDEGVGQYGVETLRRLQVRATGTEPATEVGLA